MCFSVYSVICVCGGGGCNYVFQCIQCNLCVWGVGGGG